MRAKVLISVFVAFCMFFAIGAVKDAKADQLIFPWIVKSGQVSTIVSVVNTAGVQHAYSFLGLDWQLHYQYWYKLTTNNLQTEACTNQSFKRPTSKDDIVTFDAAGNINSGMALFNDLSPYGGQSFALTAAVAPRRAFLIVDNDTPLMTAAGVNVDGTLYGEALVIELQGGAAWGYIAFNPSGGQNSAQTGPVQSADGMDPLGEILGWDGSGVEATEPDLVLGTGEVTPVVLMPAHVGKTKFFMTPMDNDGCPAESGVDGTCDNSAYNQRTGTANARITFVYHDYVVDEFYGGMFDNNENPIDFSIKKNIVCTSADNLEDILGETWGVFADTGGQGWTMVDILTGTIDQAPFNLRFDNPTDDMIVGKLEFTTGGVVIDGYPIPGTFNSFNWIRNSGSILGCVGTNCILNVGIPPLFAP